MPRIRRKKKKAKRLPSKKKPCKFCMTQIDVVDYKNHELLVRFVNDRGKIAPRRITGTCAHHQRILVRAIKRARYMALLPFVREHYR
ncbi:MAG: 30S ribosomal protein S18 [Candidatus Krumholzibacteriota bacterium]|nr:30S ribosomal protein S18 [Candidatus Krumholzibacteriota bacterium]